MRLLHRKHYQENKEKIAQYQKGWYQENKKGVLQQSKEYYRENRKRVGRRQKNYNRENKTKILQYKMRWQQHRRKTNSKYRLDENMGTFIWQALKKKKAKRHWETLIDYTLEELIEHLERQFNAKMRWNNYGNYWVVDHIKPKSLFHYFSPENLEFKQCWALRNLQPLEKIKNIKKKNCYIG